MSLESPTDTPVYYSDSHVGVAKSSAPRRPSRDRSSEDYPVAGQMGRPRNAPGSTRSQRRNPAGPNARFVEPPVPETYDDISEAPLHDPRYAEDYQDAERGWGPRASADSRRLDDAPMTRESEKPLKWDGKPPVRPGVFGRTFTQQFKGSEDDGRLNFKEMSKSDRREVMKMPYYQLMDSNFKNHIVAAFGEFMGTTMFLFFAFAGTAVANIPAGTGGDATVTTGATGFSIAVQLYISLAFGFSLMVNVWVFYRISGGLFNPAVTLALLLVKVITPFRAVFVFVAQIAGGIAAAGLASVMFPTPLNVRTSLSPGTSLVRGVFIEMVLTFELVFTIFMLAAEKHRARFIAPVGIGLALFIAEMTGVYYTGGSLNPARSFGPCVIAADFESEHWIYWVGPFGGAIAAVILYKIYKLMQYETVNPGQDSHE